MPSRRAARHLDEMLVRVVVRLDGRGGLHLDDALGAQLDSAELEPVPAPDGGPPAAFVQAVEMALRRAQEEARRRLADVLATARRGLAGEKDAALRRVGRWLAQSRARKADADRVLQAEAAVYDEAASALDGARLELDQAALVQLA